ncbi:voltage-gated inwardly rectifying potassium channel KCNH2-like isoform X2 [Tachypleus tridentatus]|uniref:voltage-gated inwardly rectifying potassium channel KCNH2-like isoform X2 n=1 Tax=Tachypleus tridentatus TaxID=6853 RepID=UPI003FD180DD
MPVRRGHVAPQNTFIDSIIRKFDNLNRRFIVANAQVENKPIIYCNDGFTELLGYTRGEIVQRSCMCEFLHGPHTSPNAVAKIAEALEDSEERQVEIVYYKKDGSKFLCSQVMAPIRNEEGVVSMFIINFEDLTDAPYRDELDDVVPSIIEPRKLFSHVPILREFLQGGPNSRGQTMDFQRCFSRSAAALGKSLRLRIPGVRRAEEQMQQTETTPTSEKQAVVMDTLDQSAFLTHHAVERTRSLEIGDHAGTHPASRDMDDISRRGIGSVTPLTSLEVAQQVQKTLKTSPFVAATANNLIKPLPNASSDSDLSRYRSQHQRARSPSLSNMISENNAKQKENSHSSTTSKFLKEMQAHSKHHVGEKVAQVLSLGADVLPEYKLQKPRVHKWTILHYSPFKAVWDWIILLLVIYTAIFTPYVAAFLLNETKTKRNKKYGEDPIVIIDLLVDVMFIIDILINFRTTYVNSNEEVVSLPGRIAVHYLRGWFIIDVVAAIPFDLLLFGSETDEV